MTPDRIVALFPLSTQGLVRAQIAVMVLFTVLASVVALLGKWRGGHFDFHYVVGNAIGGAALPPGVLLILVPFFDLPLLEILGPLTIYLALAGIIMSYLSLYALFR